MESSAELERTLDEVQRKYGSSHGRKIINELEVPDVSRLGSLQNVA